jgi:3-hydroxy acid dehydrogenase/malonic semialdehyde reductase
MSTSAVSRRLAGKTVLITGASSGIGRSTALEFARTAPQDLRIIVTARREERLHELAKQIRDEVGEGVKVLPVALDVSDPEQIKGFVERLPVEFREIDILVNNA